VQTMGQGLWRNAHLVDSCSCGLVEVWDGGQSLGGVVGRRQSMIVIIIRASLDLGQRAPSDSSDCWITICAVQGLCLLHDAPEGERRVRALVRDALNLATFSSTEGELAS